MQLTNFATNAFLPKARSSAKHPSPGSGAVPVNEGVESYRELSNDTSYQPASASHQTKIDTIRPVTQASRTEDLQIRPIFKYQDPKTLPNHIRTAVSVYQGIAEALPPQKVELLGIDVFV